METFDGEVLDHTLKWLDKTARAKPFFCWFNSTAIHIRSHSPQKYIQMAVDEGRAEEDVVRAKMIEHDEQVGSLLKKLDDLGVADNTIVIYTTDNGNELMLWPDGGYAPFRGEKGTTWEGGVRVPFLVKWPGKIKPGSVSNGIQNHEDVFATLAAAAGLPNLKQELLTGKKMGDDDLQGPPRRLQQPRPLDRQEREVRPPRDLLLRRDRPDGAARRRLEDAHRREEGGQLVEPEVLPQHSVPVQPAHGPAGEDGPGVARVGHHRAQVLRLQDVGAELVGTVPAGAPEEPDGVPASQGADTLSLKKALDEAMQKLEAQAARRALTTGMPMRAAILTVLLAGCADHYYPGHPEDPPRMVGESDAARAIEVERDTHHDAARGESHHRLPLVSRGVWRRRARADRRTVLCDGEIGRRAAAARSTGRSSAAAPARQELRFEYRRTWESDKPAARTLSYTIDVR